MSNETIKSKNFALGCLIAAASFLLLAVVLVVGGLFFVKTKLSDFDSHRNKMGIRSDFVPLEENLWYAPGFDAAMWCKLTVEAGGLEVVFDTAKVDTSQLGEEGYEFRVDWIDDDWWDAESRQLTGGEVEISGNPMRVGYVDNGDGTLTVYIFWFEV